MNTIKTLVTLRAARTFVTLCVLGLALIGAMLLLGMMAGWAVVGFRMVAG